MTRKATPDDFGFIYNLYMHPDVNPFLLYEEMDAESFRPIFGELQEAGFLYIFESDQKPVGMFKLVPLKHRNSHIVYLGGLAIHPLFSGKGLGQKMIEEIILLGGEMKFLRMELSTSVNNFKAISLYEKCGFLKEGVLKKFSFFKKEHMFIDEVLMAYLY